MGDGDQARAAHIARFADLALGHLDREYPHKLDHVLRSDEDLRPPRALHPIFHGSFDWHSSVHAHWLLVRALRLCPGLARREQIVQSLSARFTPERMSGELAYVHEPGRGSFERPYGWAWLLKLAAEVRVGGYEAWDRALAPLAQAFVDRFTAYLPKATYPTRTGTHGNTAFAVALSLDWARAAGLRDFEVLLCATARRWYAHDAGYQAWEPSGVDFLSPGLIEAECMRRAVPPDEFAAWFVRFLPGVHLREPRVLFEPARVSDRTDGHIAHLDGLNLSRAWCWRAIGGSLDHAEPRRAVCLTAAQCHLDASLPHLAADYAGEHWLATFAMLAATE